jgi:U3 small nucleolar RNA-associated protein 15
MYVPVLGQSSTIDSLFLRLRRKLEVELRLQDELIKVKGTLDMLFAFAALSA